MKDQPAVSGGIPVRHNKAWPSWPIVTEKEWESDIEPKMREVYLSRNEGLSGLKATEFSQRYAKYTGTAYATFMPHGTDSISAALAGALHLDGLEEGGEVIVPNYTFVSTARAALDLR